MENLPAHVTLGANSNAIEGGIKLWQDMRDSETIATHAKTTKSTTKAG
jgi:polyphosphate glucokinase